MKYGKIILYTDIYIKIYNYEKVRFLEMIIPKIEEKAYMHRYVYENELLATRKSPSFHHNLFLERLLGCKFFQK